MTSCYLTGVGKTSLMLRMVERQLPSNDLLLPHRRGKTSLMLRMVER